MGADKKSFVSTLAAIAAASLGVLVLPVTGLAQPCAGGTDVRNLDDSSVPASIKNQILGTPGKIISNASASYPSGKLVVIRAALQDAPINPAANTAYINEIFFGTVAGEKNVHGYYNTNSYGQLNVNSGGVPDWFTLNKKISDYNNGIEQNAVFLQDVLKKANVNWSSLDANADHSISVREAQIVILVPNALPGSGYASTRNVLAGSVATPTGTYTFPARNIVIFSLKALADPQYNVTPIRALAAVCHELGHAFFNLPDRYGANTGTGEYDMMGSANSSTWVHLTMHDKVKIGWIKPKFIQGHLGQCLQFVPSELTNSALIIVPITSFMGSPLEYWIVENRNKQYDGGEGYDDNLPDKGLAVWYNSVGTYQPSGHDDVRLVDFSKPSQNPLNYNNPGNNALFTLSTTNPSHALFNRNGQWNLLSFENVSDVNLNYSGLFVYAEF
jgi:M6 family metalloprotease-like protein